MSSLPTTMADRYPVPVPVRVPAPGGRAVGTFNAPAAAIVAVAEGVAGPAAAGPERELGGIRPLAGDGASPRRRARATFNFQLSTLRLPPLCPSPRFDRGRHEARGRHRPHRHRQPGLGAGRLRAGRPLGHHHRGGRARDRRRLLVLPGVGAFGPVARRLAERGLAEPLAERVRQGRPTLAICLGLQLLAAAARRARAWPASACCRRTVTRFAAGLRVPQLGWNRVVGRRRRRAAPNRRRLLRQLLPARRRAGRLARRAGPTTAAPSWPRSSAARCSPASSTPSCRATGARRCSSAGSPQRRWPDADCRGSSRASTCDDGRVVKGVRFQGLRDAGDPVRARRGLRRARVPTSWWCSTSAATPEGRGHALEVVRGVRRVLSLPLTVGGGVRAAADAEALLEAGADKVAVNTAAVRPARACWPSSPRRFGRQCTVLALDAARRDGGWEVVVRSGRERDRPRRGRLGPRGDRARRRRDPAHQLGPRRHRRGLRPRAARRDAGRGGRCRSSPRAAPPGPSTWPRRSPPAPTRCSPPSIFHDGDTTVADLKDAARRAGRGGAPMIIPSIDLMDGQAVQLVGGREQALDAGDPLAVAERFAVAGEIAVIDLDAALGRGDNAALIARAGPPSPVPRRRRHPRRSTRRSAGSTPAPRQVILGTAATPEVLRELPRERVIAALDAVDGEVVVEGWTERTGASVLERIAELRELVGGFLVTFVEREGRLGGRRPRGRAPRSSTPPAARPVTIAGGVTTAEEVAALDRLGADAQVGMALYTGRLPLADGFAAPLRSDRPDGLWPTVVCDEHGVALGLVYSSPRACGPRSRSAAASTGRARAALWLKGETSGATQELLRVDLDCDRDALRFTVRQRGPRLLPPRQLDLLGRGPRPAGARAPAGRPAERARRRLVHRPRCSRPRAARGQAGRGGRRAGRRRRAATRSPGRPPTCSTSPPSRWRAPACRWPTCSAELDRRGLRRPPPGRRRRTFAGEERLMMTWRRLAAGRGRRRSTREPVDAGHPGSGRGHRRRRSAPRASAALRAFAERFGDRAPGRAAGARPRRARGGPRPPAARPARAARAHRRRASAPSPRPSARRSSTSTCRCRAAAPATGVAPVERAGCYAPGGRFPLPSSVLMTAVTARAAGVAEVWVASPRPAPSPSPPPRWPAPTRCSRSAAPRRSPPWPTAPGRCPACDVVVGPGNRWVTAAKQLVAGTVGIDMLAGPSELVVLADATADPAVVAADLLAQAEHDPDALPVLVTTSAELADAVEAELARQLADLPTGATAAAALAQRLRGGGPRPRRGDRGLRPARARAPAGADRRRRRRWPRGSATAAGCSSAAPRPRCSATTASAPTTRCPPAASPATRAGCSVLDFLRVRTWLALEPGREAAELARDAAALARLEGLEAHARAAERRLCSAGILPACRFARRAGWKPALQRCCIGILPAFEVCSAGISRREKCSLEGCAPKRESEPAGESYRRSR